MKRNRITLIVIFTVLIVVSCKRDPYRIRLTGPGVNIEILRLEKDLFSLNPDEIAGKIEQGLALSGERVAEANRRILNTLTWDNHLEQLLALYETVRKAKGASGRPEK